jgi:hypothetical protein
VELQFFACAVSGQRGELPERFRWVERSALGDYRFPPANAELLVRLKTSEAPPGGLLAAPAD